MYTQQFEQWRMVNRKRWWWNYVDKEGIRCRVCRYPVTGNSILANTVTFTVNTALKSALVCGIPILKAREFLN